MNQFTVRSKASELERLFADSGAGGLLESIKRNASRQVADKGAAASNYSLYIIRNNTYAGSEIFGPHKLHAGTYNENVLYGQHASPAFRFRDAAKRLAAKARLCSGFNEEPLEFAHQASLLWSEIGQLKDFFRISDEIDEIIAALRTARFQHLRIDTSPEVVFALTEILLCISEAISLDTDFVDRIVDLLEGCGIDTFAQDPVDASND